MMYKMTVRRKLAIATWSSPREGNIYGKLTIDATEALAYIEHLRKTTGEKISITHLVGKAVAEALKEIPSLNGYIRLGKYIPHETVNISYLVALEDGKDLAKAKIERASEKSLLEIARELREKVGKLRKGKDEDFEKNKVILRLLPTWLLRPLVWFIGFLSSSMGWRFKALGVEPFPFGSCIVTSVGMFGLDEGFVPPTPFARVPVYVLVGSVHDAPAVHEGEIKIRPQLIITATIDHRFMDGHQGGKLAKIVRKIMENPWSLDESQPPALNEKNSSQD